MRKLIIGTVSTLLVLTNLAACDVFVHDDNPPPIVVEDNNPDVVVEDTTPDVEVHVDK